MACYKFCGTACWIIDLANFQQVTLCSDQLVFDDGYSHSKILVSAFESY